MTILKKIYIASYAAAVTAGAIFLFAGEAKAEKLKGTNLYALYHYEADEGAGTPESCVIGAWDNTRGLGFGFGVMGYEGVPFFRFSSLKWAMPADGKYRVTMIIDGKHSFSGTGFVVGEKNNKVEMSFNKGVQAVAAIAAGKFVALFSSSGRRLARWNLRGSGAALTRLIDCWNTRMDGAGANPFDDLQAKPAKTNPFERQS